MLPLVRPRQQRPSELAAVAELAADGFGGLVGRVRELHDAIADRAFGASPGSRVPHDAIAGGVYTALRAGGSAAGRVLAAGLRAGDGGRRITDDPRVRLVQGALNGLLGDRLERDGNELAVPMAVRVGGADVPPRAEDLRAAFPDATGHVVVFVHGLFESDASWALGAERRGGTYASRVVAPLGATSVHLRYNSGLHISDNGRRLAALLEELVEGWPVKLTSLALVGHSMGGLVLRSAAHAGVAAGHRWPQLVTGTVCLGSPHLGAPLEQGTHLAAWALHRVPEARPVASVLRTRSAGIRDLRHGALVDTEWRDVDPDERLPFDRADVPLLPGVRHHVVAATLTADPEHPLGRIVGDLLVLAPSAHGLRRRERVIAFEDDDCHHLGGHDHFSLLNTPRLDPLLTGWLAP